MQTKASIISKESRKRTEKKDKSRETQIRGKGNIIRNKELRKRRETQRQAKAK
jgi:hypothetical protein